MTRNVLVVAAHPDDEVLGCGGTIARHSQEGDNVGVLFIADGVGARGIISHSQSLSLNRRKQSAQSALQILGAHVLKFLDLPDNKLDTLPFLEIVQAIESITQDFQPTILYTHHYGDLNIDHSIVSKACITAHRPIPTAPIENILFYEVISSTYWGTANNFFKPNYFVDTSHFETKKNLALECYKEEMRDFPHYRSLETSQSLGKYRGSQVGVRCAEAFELFKMIVR